MFTYFKKLFFMSEEEYEKAINFYIKKFHLKEEWNFMVVEKLPIMKINYKEPEKVLALTDWNSRSVIFKKDVFTKFKWLARAYIRHECRHCQQMEKIHMLMEKRYGGEEAKKYTAVLIAIDNSNGYNKSLMEADAWLAFFGIYMNIDKVVNKIIKRNMPFLNV